MDQKKLIGTFAYDRYNNTHIIHTRPSSPEVGVVPEAMPEAAFTSGAVAPIVVFMQLRRVKSILNGSGTLDVPLVRTAVLL